MFEIDYQKKAKEIQKWIAKTVHEAGFEKVIVAVSGGVDSAVSLSLTVHALGVDNVYGLLLPCGKLSTKSLIDGKLVARSVGLAKEHIFVKDIGKLVNKIVTEDMDNIRRGNIMARLRMTYLFDYAKKVNALVVGTENKSEHYLGYFTRFGDEASDLEPIRNLYKTQVWEMGKYLGLPPEIIEKAPSANLWEGQSDEGEFGFSYTQADTVLYHFFEEGVPKEGIVAQGIPENIVEKVLQRVAQNEFKHHLPKIME